MCVDIALTVALLSLWQLSSYITVITVDAAFLPLLQYCIISNIGAAPIKVPPRVYLIFPFPIVSALGHWN